ncbi:MAG: iron-containing alcohol dehydrogenase [Clostridia bacterium]|nr:iron-containing alcohol dehydrogenase [Clostridia bacterium]
MNFDFNMPVEIMSGIDCVKKHAKVFNLGKKCLIVTGRRSAVASGALDDVVKVLGEKGVEYKVYDKITENPLLSVCFDGGREAIAFGADFIVGIGGGSVIDAAKAISAFGANADVCEKGLFTDCKKKSLPLIAIPTTAGTGSEGNNYAVISLDGENKKRTFKNEWSYPTYAFLDAKYTMSLSKEYTVSTALDAFCHCIESYLSPKSTVISRLLSVWGARAILDIISKKQDGFTLEERESLLYASCEAGIAINTTGTGFPHPLGYNITMFRSLPHGKACALFTEAYIDYNRKCDEGVKLTDAFFAAVGYTRDQICEITNGLCGFNDKLSDDEIELYLSKTADAGNYQNSPYVINKDEMREIYKKYCQ